MSYDLIVGGFDFFQEVADEVLFLLVGGRGGVLGEVDEGLVESVGEVVDGVVGLGQVLL